MSRSLAARGRAPDVTVGALGYAADPCGAPSSCSSAGSRRRCRWLPVYAVELVAAPPPAPAARPAPEAVSRPPNSRTPGRRRQRRAGRRSRQRPRRRPSPRRRPRPTPTPTKPVQAPESRWSAPVTGGRAAPGETPSTGTDAVERQDAGAAVPVSGVSPEHRGASLSPLGSGRRQPEPARRSQLPHSAGWLVCATFASSRRSGNFSFDLSAQGAIEAAGNAKAFGPLPDGWDADVLPVSFFFTPAGQ